MVKPWLGPGLERQGAVNTTTTTTSRARPGCRGGRSRVEAGQGGALQRGRWPTWALKHGEATREPTGRRRQGEVRSLDDVEAVGAVNASEAWRWQSMRAEAGRGTWRGDSSLVATCSSSTWRGEGGADPGVGSSFPAAEREIRRESSNGGGGVPVIHGRETMGGGEETRWGKGRRGKGAGRRSTGLVDDGRQGRRRARGRARAWSGTMEGGGLRELQGAPPGRWISIQGSRWMDLEVGWLWLARCGLRGGFGQGVAADDGEDGTAPLDFRVWSQMD